MNTSEALESITDAGKFENLVYAILSNENPDYRYIIQTGVNSQGKTIKAPIDGFCLVPDSNPNHFISLEITTTSKNKLEAKWLNNTQLGASFDGDLIKAIKFVKKNKFDLEAKLTVILVTNRRLTPDFLVRIYSITSNQKVNVDIWDQSRLVNFLDNNPEGHWLRNKFLGIEAEKISESLLDDICHQSLNLYKNDIVITDFTNLVSRKINSTVQKGLLNNSINFLVGESGFGKSVICYQSFKRHLKNGNYALWIPPNIIKESITLESAIDKTLRSIYPQLLLDSGQSALNLVSPDKKFLIVIDDINRDNNTVYLINKILSWFNYDKNSFKSLNSNDQGTTPPYVLICPVWPNVLKSRISDNHNSQINEIMIESLTSVEGSEIILKAASKVGITLTNAQSTELSKKMNNDPFSISLFVSLLTNKIDDLNLLVEKVIEKFIHKKIMEIVNKSTHYIVEDYIELLTNLNREMILNYNLNPSWVEIKKWLNKDSIIIIREILKDGNLCSLKDEKLVFVHDRVRDFFTVQNITTMLTNDPKNKIFEDPFFAELIGRSISNYPQTGDFIYELRDRNFLSLLEALKSFNQNLNQKEYHDNIKRIILNWSEEIEIDSISDSYVYAICRSLVEVDSEIVLTITDKLPRNYFRMLARLRNGDINSAIEFYSFDQLWFNDSLHNQIIEHTRSKHKPLFIEVLRAILKSNNINDFKRHNTLIIAGFFGFEELKHEVLECWNLLESKKDHLPEALWAVIRCCGENPETIIKPVIDYFNNLPEDDDSHSNKKYRVFKKIRSPLSHYGINKKVLKYLISLSTQYKSLKYPIAQLCEKIDEPEAIEFLVKYAVELEKEVDGTEFFSPWLLNLTSDFMKFTSESYEPSEKSRNYLKIIWQNSKNEEYKRTISFKMWIKGANLHDLKVMKEINSDSILFNDAVLKRVELGDFTTVYDLASKLKEDSYWFRIAHNVWCDEIKEVTEEYFSLYKKNIPKEDLHKSFHESIFAQFLVKIPSSEAEGLLEKYWDYVCTNPLFVQAAMCICTDKLLKLVDHTINKNKNTVDFFKYFPMNFILWEDMHVFTTKRQFDSLLPYLNLIEKNEIRDFADACRNNGFPEWGKEHLYEYLDQMERKRLYPTDNELIQELDEKLKLFLEKKYYFISSWLDGFESRKEDKDKILKLLDKWLSSNKSLECLEIVGECIKSVGTRKDLAILYKYPINDSDKIIEDVSFFVRHRSLN